MEIRIFSSILEIGEELWKRLENPEFPFTDYAFLSSLEESSSLGRRTGWEAFYFVGYQADTAIVAWISYLKTNSYGEYIFDFAWAQAFESLGMSYYPKLVSAIPFSPVTGSKLLFSKFLGDDEKQKLGALFMEEIRNLLTQKLIPSLGLSSVHALFVKEEEIPLYKNLGFMERLSFQYHFDNPGYGSFEDFLGALKSKRRKEIRRERHQVEKQNLKIIRMSGDELGPREAMAMANFYADTTAKMGGYAYLTPAFFRLLFERMKSKILFVGAENEAGQYVAGALNIIGSKALYGRHWGCLEDYRSLHFELCYYQGIEFVIQSKLPLFEAGAQGEHKFQRGFLPKPIYSMHLVPQENLSEAIEDFCKREAEGIRGLFENYEEHNPFSEGSI